MFTDTHCHVLKQEYDNYDAILKELATKNIKRIIINGYNLDSNKEVINLVNKYDNVYGSLGIHPNYIEEMKDIDIEFIKQNINHNKIIAIGEIGLDYYRNTQNKEEQKDVFKSLMKLAEIENKPVIIHNRNATDDLIKILKEYNVKGIIHCFTGSLETAKEYIKLNYKLGINGILTFKNSNLPKTISALDLSHILLETDAPYLSPEPKRNEKNQPANIIYTAEKLASIYNIDLDKLAIKLEDNFHEIFDI